MTAGWDPPRRVPVLIVGRGPVGMTLALRLAGFGVPSLVVDPAGPDPLPGSKALCMHREAMEILDRVGCGRPLADEGVYWPLGRTYHRDTEVAQVRFPPWDGVGFPPFVNYPQRDTEAVLLGKLRAHPLVRALLDHRVTELDQDPDGVTAVIDGPDGALTCRADYVVGCDGARSTVRKRFGFGFRGHSYTSNFLLCDIRAELPFPDERRLYFNPSFNPGRTVLVHPVPDSVWHIDWQVGPEPLDLAEERRSGRLDARVRCITGEARYELLWLSTYTFRQLIADTMRVGRAFLAGDAAHLVSPYGARGLNSGLADADNLAWKLALVINGQARPTLLDSYDAERRPAALEHQRISDATARFMAPRTRRQRLWRAAVLAASAHLPAARRLINAGRFYQPTAYRDSPIIAAAQGAPGGTLPAPGTVVPDAPCRLIGGAGGDRLRELLGDGFVALLLPGTTRGAVDAAEQAGQALRAWPAGLPCCRVALVSPAIAEVDDTDALTFVEDVSGAIARAYAPDRPGLRVYLIRPDAYIAARFELAGPQTLGHLLADAVADAIGGRPAASVPVCDLQEGATP